MSSFNPTVVAAIERDLTRFETRRSAILPILHTIHDHYGYVSEEQVAELESRFDLPKVHVQEVISFYTRFQQHKPCRFHIQFCDNLVCRMFESDKIIAKLRTLPAPEGMISVEPVPCLGVCDGAPAMLVNSDRHLHANAERAVEIIREYLGDEMNTEQELG
ncbi:MAG: NAD(P)H-dependent oxidoreductase subunit E [Pseudomonadota bacterium]|nr:NAD(P)H-dependent oxidoreductase subunit E [Pseudomonadota bacterium]